MAERAVDCYVAALPEGQREIAEAVRRLVRSVVPEAGAIACLRYFKASGRWEHLSDYGSLTQTSSA